MDDGNRVDSDCRNTLISMPLMNTTTDFVTGFFNCFCHRLMPLTAAEKQRRYRERRNADAVRQQENLRKDRERWHKNKIVVKDMSERAGTAASTGKKTMEVQQAETAQSAQSIEADSRPRRPIISTREGRRLLCRTAQGKPGTSKVLGVSCSM